MRPTKGSSSSSSFDDPRVEVFELLKSENFFGVDLQVLHHQTIPLALLSTYFILVARLPLCEGVNLTGGLGGGVGSCCVSIDFSLRLARYSKPVEAPALTLAVLCRSKHLGFRCIDFGGTLIVRECLS